MRIFRSLIVVVLVIASATLSFADTSGSWVKVRTMPISFKFYYAGFSDAQNGLTIGYAGEVHQTTDGGATWPQAANGSACRFGLEIVNAQVAYHCGNAGNVGKSVDGGKTWFRVSDFGGSSPLQARYLSFFSESSGWISTGIRLASTEDSGATWQEITPPKGIAKILAIARVDSAKGYLFDRNGFLWSSADAGKTWTKNRVVSEQFNNNIEPTPIACLRCSDASRISLLFFRFGDQPGWVLRSSTDAGSTWSDQAIDAVLANPWLDRSVRFLTTSDYVKKEVTLYSLQ